MSHADEILSQDKMKPAEKKKEFEARAKELGYIGKTAEIYIRQQMIIWEKSQRAIAEYKAKLIGSTIQQLLPEIFEDKRAIPNSFLRGALFGMVRKGRRALVGDMPIFTMSQYKLTYTGYELDQNDLEVWDTLIYLAKTRKIDNELRITIYDLCQQMRLKYTNTSRDALIARVKRLQVGQVNIKTEGKEYFGSLIDDGYIDTAGDCKLVIRYNKTLAPLFMDKDYTLINADIRHFLGDNQLARWLYSFYESHDKPMPFAIDFVQKLCRSDSGVRDFKYKLKLALELVQKAHLSVDLKSKWNWEITNNNYLCVYPRGKTKKQIDLFS